MLRSAPRAWGRNETKNDLSLGLHKVKQWLCHFPATGSKEWDMNGLSWDEMEWDRIQQDRMR